MKAIFYVLSLLVVGAAAFFSFQNANKFKEQQEIRIQRAADSKAMEDKATKKKDDLEKETVTRNEANRERESLKASIDSLKAKGKALQRDIATINATLEQQKGKIAELEKAKAKANEILGANGVSSVEELPGEIAKLQAEQMTKQKNLEELKTIIEGLEKNVATNNEEIARLSQKDSERSTRIRQNAMEAPVTAVNEDWGFVIIGAGSNTGFTPQTKLLVRRNGRTIGEVKPSSIERSQTIAEIDPDTLAPGARIQPGDRVILASPATD